MFTNLHKNSKLQLFLGLLFGIIFGFLLNKSGVTVYDVILNQLLLNDWTVFKVMLSAIIVGTIGIHLLYDFKKIEFHPKSVSFISIITGGSLFGIGFALLGYCPGIIAGAIGEGSLDALIAGLPGMVLGSGIFIYAYDYVNKKILSKSFIINKTFPEILKINHWLIIIPLIIILTILLIFIENL